MEKTRTRGGDVKKAPPGYYTAKQARDRLGLTPSAFQTLINKGEVSRIIPPLRSEGIYPIAEVDKLASKQDLFYLQHVSQIAHEPVTFERAQPSDAEGIYDVLASLWGSENATPPDLRRSWYKVNDQTDYIIKFRSLVLGYANITPYRPEVLEALMAGKKRGWDIKPDDILRFEPGKSYDVFTGIAVRQDVPGHTYYANRLIINFFGAICDLARKGILIKRMYATSDQPSGIDLSQRIGFQKQDPQPDDKYGRFILNMETAETALARKYREVVQNKGPYPVRSAKHIKYDPGIEDITHKIVETLSSENTIQNDLVIAVYLSLIDHLAESPQMSTEQQALFRMAYEISKRSEGNV